MDQIAPHGGKLVDCMVDAERLDEYTKKAENLPRIDLNYRQLSDLELIATGVFSPLEGFMGKEDYLSVIDHMRLSNGLPWTIPVVLAVDEDLANQLPVGSQAALWHHHVEQVVGIIEVREQFEWDLDKEAWQVYGTNETAHPGVEALHRQGKVLLSGPIKMLRRPWHPFGCYLMDPKDTREHFRKKGWKRIVGFQTRNPIHRAHEYIQKCALEVVDGLLIHPLVGETQAGDIPAQTRMKCYEVLIDGYYPKDRVLLSVYPAAMRYAGPREAVFHAIARKNYGCTHFIVGRDHAGVGNYYGSFDAHAIFDQFDSEEIAITPMFFDHSFWCKKCEGMASYKTCPHNAEEHLILSGTKVREMLRAGELPPQEFTRPEIAEVLIADVKASEAEAGAKVGV